MCQDSAHRFLTRPRAPTAASVRSSAKTSSCYLNKTCGSIEEPNPWSPWNGLPSNWTALLSPSLAELRPWPAVVVSNNISLLNCPTPAANLGVFAGTNVAMLILTPLLGRRKVVSRLTFGFLGKPHSQGWMLMGPLSAGLQVSANAVNLALIRATPGYEGARIRDLMMLWLSRPRLAWLAVFLIVFEADEAMYFSCAATTLAAEVILQILSSYN